MVLKIILVVFCLAGLVGIRVFEEDLFYDPLLCFFENDYLQQSIPHVDYLRFYLNLLFRFYLNTLFSIALLKSVFNIEVSIAYLLMMFSVIGLLSIVLVYLFMVLCNLIGYLPLFYTRRILIQPILLLLLFPYFALQKSLNR